jgi:hypothetical protein
MAPKQRKSTTARPTARKGQVLDRLQAGEAAEVLRTLLARHPALAAEAAELAKSVVADVDGQAIADDLEQVLLDLDLDDLNARAGRTSRGYVEPTEAAWELVEEAVAPHLDEMKRRVALGLEAAAVAACQGIVLGLYRCRNQATDGVIEWASDAPAEMAGEALATLARASATKHRRAWRLPAAFTAQVPDWADLVDRPGRSREEGS